MNWDTQDSGACARRNTDTHTHTGSHNHRNISNTLPLSVRTSAKSLHPNHTDVPLGTSAGCGGAAQGAFLGSWGAAEGQTEPQSLDESFLCGTQSIVCAGKGHGDGNTAQSWTLSSDSGSVSVCMCLCQTPRQEESECGREKEKCVLTYERRVLCVCVCVYVCDIPDCSVCD